MTTATTATSPPETTGQTTAGPICLICDAPIGNAQAVSVRRMRGGGLVISAPGEPVHPECFRKELLHTANVLIR